MGRLETTAIPLRFLLTTGHFLAAVLVFYHKDANIQAGLGSEATSNDFDKAERSLVAALALTMISSFLSFLGMFTGVSLFFARVNLLQILAQFFGGVLTAWFIVDVWHWKTFWYITPFCSLLPAVAEVVLLVMTFGFHIIEY